MTHAKKAALTMAAAACLFAAGCHKKTAATAPPTPQAAAVKAAPSQPAPAPAKPVSRPAAAVAKPASNYPNAATRARIDQLLARIDDAYFDYDKASLRSDATKTLTADSSELRDILKDYPDYKLTIEGYCDERGSGEYNIALGQRRAQAAKDFLVAIGIPATQLNTVSYGKERPACTDSTEACYQKNRRIHISPADQNQTKASL
ncbi:MAG: OmpA family protein [Acidobacteria bacterium]|nr:OmpA family protein [Acidobacteriota bacterium]